MKIFKNQKQVYTKKDYPKLYEYIKNIFNNDKDNKEFNLPDIKH